MGQRQTIPAFHGNEARQALGRQVWRSRLGRQGLLRLPKLDFFDLQYKEKPASFRFPPHRHATTFELYYVDRGRVRFSLAGKPFRPLERQQLLLISPGLVHSVEGDGHVPSSVITLHFNSRDLLRRLPRLRPWLGRAIPHDAGLFAGLDRLCAAARSTADDRGPRITAALFSLLLGLADLDPNPAPARGPAPQPTELVGRVEAYLREHLQERLHLGRLAAALGCSVSTLTHDYRRRRGRTPTAFLLRCRVDQAKELLRQPGLPVKAITQLSGFASQSAFGRSFLRLEGMTPGDYRRTLASAQPLRTVRSMAKRLPKIRAKQ